MLGVRSLGSQDQPDSFEISARPNRFQRVRLHLSGRDVQINHIALHFADGTIRKEPFDITLMRNTSSRWIAVDPVKPLSKVVIHRGVPGSERGAARVELIGRPVLEAMLPEAAKLSGDDGWVLIASQSGRTVRINDGRMPVAANRGGFAKLRLVRVGRLPMPNGLSLWNGTKPDELIELRSAKNSDEFASA